MVNTKMLSFRSSFLCLAGLSFSLSLASTEADARSAASLNNRLNPEISLNLVSLGGYSTRSSDHEDETESHGPGQLETGISIQELELRFSGNADPYLRLDVALAGHLHGDGIEIAFEEAYISTLSLPDVTLRLGQFRVNFAKANLQHAHARRFITTPLPLTSLFGIDHLVGTGLSVDYLAPLPFFAELNLQMINAHWTQTTHEHTSIASDEDLHAAADAHLFTYVAHLKTFFDLNDAISLEVGLSGLANTDETGDWQNAWGADLTLKWVPTETSRYTSLEWLSEYMSAGLNGRQRDGLYTGLRYQTGQRWWLQMRGALVGVATDVVDRTYRAEALLAFAPSERTALRLQYAYEGSMERGDDDGLETDSTHTHIEDPVHEVFLQFIVSLGSHPAHAY